jgi:hypothetical protein
MIARARDKTKYPLLFEEDCNYGFRRNMFGIRWLGVTVALITAVALGLQLYSVFSSHEKLAVITLAFEFVNLTTLLACVACQEAKWA